MVKKEKKKYAEVLIFWFNNGPTSAVSMYKDLANDDIDTITV